ncbi:MAG: hypothetical protein A3C43_07660 [Candidatus Schekmanbacteria bacterium RIFCSPHIGHO2_02_FULL_38_11]|uniref:histidine kinase n=1 Tax=Candidatus Schekmanbacteria bacterium RIFCSPLOWO2_12_FULL_38_15 TaxID=1817883 RepID=A0A1F7SHS8_9BACT|nr:MAG: hypothetical protein A2043_11200 [Candidatus Schekmanbacteria bacterium GWA2_38_9]OGL48911.1 MAG: hypothetical protein A3C43_07660 [Candidatus Schekmanbacteria bacterium RIFCSPHIGHO2_02_FULL_38_11]OGL49872.1 MAG: hypothetical protein A3H37_09700 [Candidatus Schekmanbacteria bacterium RIFCSPLOWO2_02_FULL_38_14]OGL52788.1 MAG: hypothetical protein A3G31_00100 [Candidatus Schekmanbacteria bacterium RIFCSPLOWO2_12_FULL_38_15]
MAEINFSSLNPSGIKWLMTARVIVVTALLGTTILVEAQHGGSYISPYLSILYFLIIVTYFLTILYSLLLNRIKALTLFAYIQIFGDLLFDSTLIYITGGVGSPFIFLYFLSIIASSVILFRQGSLITASLSCLLFSALAIFQYNDILLLPIPTILLDISTISLSLNALFFKVFLNIAAFYLVAFFSSRVSESLRSTHEELEEKKGIVKELQNLNENILQSLTNGLITTDLSGIIISFNKASEEITGWRRGEVVGKCWDNFFPQFPARELLLKVKVSQGNSFTYEIEFLKNQNMKYLGFTVSLLKDEGGNITGLIGNFRDLTDIRKMEEYLKRIDRLAAIGEVAAGMAHEIRNPMASISGSVQVLKEKVGDNGITGRLMDIVIKESERLDGIINNFLQYARPKPIQFVFCNINYILNSVVTLLKNNPKYGSNLNISINCETENLSLMADSKQLEQVFWNLAINAMEAMPNGGDLRILVSRDRRKNHFSENSKNDIPYIKFLFSDTGVGISHNNRAKLFSPFYTTKEGGTGLGLAIVYRIVEEHHGIIEVESEPEKGSRFIIYLPEKQML